MDNGKTIYFWLILLKNTQIEEICENEVMQNFIFSHKNTFL